MRILVILLALVTIGTACAPPSTGGSTSSGEAPKVAAPKRIVAAIRGDPKTLSDPANAAAGGSTTAGVPEIEQMLNAGLLTLDPQGELRPLLAEAAPTIENGLWKLLHNGGMETTWRLKPNVQWHDGQPVVADDFVFTATVRRDRAIPMSQVQAFQFLDTVEALDAQTVKATWKSTFVDADKLFTQSGGINTPPMPKHLLEPAYLEDKANFAGSPYLNGQYVGAGPYRLKEWVLGSHVVLEANDRYILGRPKVDQIEVKFILDTNTIMANLLAGEVQLTLGRGMTPEQAITLREQWRDGIVDAPLQNTTSLFPQQIDAEPRALTDARFRRALLHAVDRQQMVDFFLSGLVPIAHSIIGPDEPDYPAIESSLVRYDFDPRRAVEILDGMGLARGADGFYVDPNTGRRMTIEIRSRTHVLREKVQQVLADEWARVGIVGQPLVISEQAVNDRVSQSTFPGFYFRFGAANQITNWRSSGSPLPENNYVGSNTMRYRNPEYDTLVERYANTIPRPERLAVLAQMVAHTTDQVLPIPLYHEPEPVFINNRLVNVIGGRGTNIQGWNVHEWDVR